MSKPRTPNEAVELLSSLGAGAWLVQHHRLVVEAASALCEGVRGPYDATLVLLGAALHDAGKILHPEEMSRPGCEHEKAGRELLVQHGVPPEVARFCETHARWDDPSVGLEDLLVAAADKLWKGQRHHELEDRLVSALASATHRERWEVFTELDPLFESIAADGDARLARSRV